MIKRPLTLVLCVLFLGLQLMPFAYADLSPEQEALFKENINYFNADSCGPNSGASATSGTGPVYIMGDSITHLAESTYKKTFSAGGWTPTVEGLDSRHIVDAPPSPSGLDQIKQTDDKSVIGNAKAIVIALGTNDSGENATTIKNNVAKLMDQLKSEDTNYAPIYWVNILDTRSDANSKKTNQAILDGVGTDAAVIDWYNKAKSNADTSSFNGGVHPTKQADISLLVNLVYDTVNGTRNGAAPVQAGDCTCTTASVNLTGKDNEEKTWNYFKGKGLSDKQVAGIMGNMINESHFDPEIMQRNGQDSKDPYDAQNLGWGIIQWSGNGDSRSTGDKVTKDYQESGVQGPVYELATQLDMVWQHMHNHPVVTQPFDLGYYKTLTNEQTAAEYFRAHIEGGKNSAARQQSATDILGQYGGKSVGGSVSDSGSGCPGANSQSPDCSSAKGDEKILCEAKKYDPADYVWGNGHSGGAAYHKACPTIEPNNSSCGLDCSGLVSVAVYDAFKGSGALAWDTNSLRSDSSNWKEVTLSQVQAGDVVEPDSGHVEIIDHVTGSKIFTFGAHSSNKPQPDQIGPDTWTDQPAYRYFHYIGQGSGS